MKLNKYTTRILAFLFTFTILTTSSQAWIGTALGIASTVLGIGASIAGGKSSALTAQAQALRQQALVSTISSIVTDVKAVQLALNQLDEKLSYTTENTVSSIRYNEALDSINSSFILAQNLNDSVEVLDEVVLAADIQTNTQNLLDIEASWNFFSNSERRSQPGSVAVLSGLQEALISSYHTQALLAIEEPAVRLERLTQILESHSQACSKKTAALANILESDLDCKITLDFVDPQASDIRLRNFLVRSVDTWVPLISELQFNPLYKQILPKNIGYDATDLVSFAGKDIEMITNGNTQRTERLDVCVIVSNLIEVPAYRTIETGINQYETVPWGVDLVISRTAILGAVDVTSSARLNVVLAEGQVPSNATTEILDSVEFLEEESYIAVEMDEGRTSEKYCSDFEISPDLTFEAVFSAGSIPCDDICEGSADPDSSFDARTQLDKFLDRSNLITTSQILENFSIPQYLSTANHNYIAGIKHYNMGREYNFSVLKRMFEIANGEVKANEVSDFEISVLNQVNFLSSYITARASLERSVEHLALVDGT